MWKQVRAWAAGHELARRAGRYRWVRVPVRAQYYDELFGDHLEAELDALVFDSVDLEREAGKL